MEIRLAWLPVAALLLPASVSAAERGWPAAQNLARGFQGAQGLVQLVLEPGGGADVTTLQALAARMRAVGVDVATQAPAPGRPRDHYYLVTVGLLTGSDGAFARTRARVFARDGQLLGVITDGDPALEASLFPNRVRMRRPHAGHLDPIGAPSVGAPSARQTLLAGGAGAVTVAFGWATMVEVSKLGFDPIGGGQVGPAILGVVGLAALLAGTSMSPSSR